MAGRLEAGNSLYTKFHHNLHVCPLLWNFPEPFVQCGATMKIACNPFHLSCCNWLYRFEYCSMAMWFLGLEASLCPLSRRIRLELGEEAGPGVAEHCAGVTSASWPLYSGSFVPAKSLKISKTPEFYPSASAMSTPDQSPGKCLGRCRWVCRGVWIRS